MTTTTYTNAIRIGANVLNFSNKINVAVRLHEDTGEANFRIFVWQRSSKALDEEMVNLANQIADITNGEWRRDRFGIILKANYLNK